MKLYGKGDRRDIQAQQIWVIVSSYVRHEVGGCLKADGSTLDNGIITYGRLAELMGMSRQAGRTLGIPLGIVGQFCLENDLPALNAVVVNQETGLPGDHVVLGPGRSVEEEQALILKTNWFSIRPPSARDFRGFQAD